jgi:hypothetical protein
MFKEAEDLQPKSPYLMDGTHDLLISQVETVETQDGTNLMFVEYTVLATVGTSPTRTINVDGVDEQVDQCPHEVGDTVKQSFSTSGAPAWQLQKSMRVLKRLVTLAGQEINTESVDELGKYMGVNGQQSPLVGSTLRVVGRRAVSQNGKHFTKFDYMASRVERGDTQAEPETKDLSGDVPF